MSKSQTFALNKQVGQLLAAERISRGQTQTELALKLRKPQSFVSKYESGQRFLTVGDLSAICKAIGLKPSNFVKLID